MNLPNQLTLLRIALTPVFIFLLFLPADNVHIVSFVVFLAAAFTDWYDGYTARRFGLVSKWGRFFDPLADKILVLSALACFWYLEYYPLWTVVIVIVRDFVITVMRAYAIRSDIPMVTRFYAKCKTFFQMTFVLLLFIYHLLTRGQTHMDGWSGFRFISENHIVLILMIVLTAVTVLTGLGYIAENLPALRKKRIDFAERI